MTPEQITMARALAFCNFGFEGDRKFANRLALKANTSADSPLSADDATKLAKAVVRFHAQIKPEVLKLARAALPQGEDA